MYCRCINTSASCRLVFVQRQGSPRELLRGPVLYGVVHAALTVGWWRDSPAALVALAALCAGQSTRLRRCSCRLA